MSCRRCSVNVLFLHSSLLFSPFPSVILVIFPPLIILGVVFSLSLSLSFFFCPCPRACGILVPWAGIKLVPHAAEAWSFSHWTAREVLLPFLFCCKAQPEPICGISLIAPCPGADLRSWPWATSDQPPPWRACMVVPPYAGPKGHFASWGATYDSPAPSLNDIFIVLEPHTW